MTWIANEGESLLTLWDGQESEDMNSVAVSTPHIVVHIPKRDVEGVVLIMSSGDRDGGLVTTNDDGGKHRTMGRGILGDDVLSNGAGQSR